MLSQTAIEGRGASFLGFGGASGKGRCTMVGLGVAGLNFLGVAHFLFSVALPFLMVGLVFGSEGLNWLMGAGIGPILLSTSKMVFIFLIIMGWTESCAPGCTFDQLCCLVPSKYMCTLHRCDFHFYIYHLYQEFAPEETVQEFAFWL